VTILMDVLCFGSIIIDSRYSDEEAATFHEPLQIVDRAVNLEVGGMPILAMTMRRMGFDVGLTGCVGRDIAGYGLRAYLSDEAKINVDSLRLVAAPTSSSFIRLTSEQRYIKHAPGASAKLRPRSSDADFLATHKPKLVAIGYSGLLPYMDANGGRAMAEWIRTVQDLGGLAALDTHTVPPYRMLEKPVPGVDVFIVNKEEGEQIAGRSAAADPSGVLDDMWRMFPQADPGRYRLLGVTEARGVQLAYGCHRGFENAWIPNPHYGAFQPADLTGAGDYFRAGLYGYIVTHVAAFHSGDLDFERAGLAGHDSARDNLMASYRDI